MAQFKDVFSTTAKVILSLLLISLAIGAGLFFLGSVILLSSPAQLDPLFSSEEEWADGRRGTMSPVAWNILVDHAIANHCVTDGMSEEEVARRWASLI
jgi:hypothetical protein